MNTTMNNPKTLTASNFDQDVLKNSKPVVVDFWAEWCGSCKVMGYMLEEVAGDMTAAIVIAKLNVDHYPDIAARYGIEVIPTLIIFKNGEVVDRVVGVVPKKVLAQRLAALMQAA